MNELLDATLRPKPGRKQPDLCEHANAVATRQRAHAQNGAVRRKLCLDNDDRLLGAILKRLDCTARQDHWSYGRLTRHVEDCGASSEVSLRSRAADDAWCVAPLTCCN